MEQEAICMCDEQASFTSLAIQVFGLAFHSNSTPPARILVKLKRTATHFYHKPNQYITNEIENTEATENREK